jgi:hypothetical protein
MYKKTEGHKVYGVYFLGMPALTIRDPDLVRRVLVKDFEHFVDRQEHMFDTVSDSKTDKANNYFLNLKLCMKFIFFIFLTYYLLH